MKNIKIFAISLAIAGILASCDSKIEEIKPENSITEESIFLNKGEALSVVTGMYGHAQKDDIFNGTPQLMGEWQSDNVDFVGSFTSFQEIREYTTLSDNTSIRDIYEQSYDLIRQANIVMANIPGVPDPSLTDIEKTEIVAQAKFLRALAYLQLNNLFGNNTSETNESVPIVTTILTPNSTLPARSTIGEVYTQIETDLNDAINDLNGNTIVGLTGDANTFANKEAARALLARVKLYRGQYAEAAQLANQVIASGFGTLAGNYAFFNTTSSEFLFTLVNTTSDGQDSGEGFSGLTNPSPQGRGDAPFSQNLLDAFAAEAGDLRFSTLNQMGDDANGVTNTFTTKFPDAITNSANAPVIRITEMYLTRAEANLRAGTSVGATPLADINQLRTRAGLGNLASVTIDDILNERRKELCFEGHRRMDLIRTGQNLRRSGMPQEALSAPGADKVTFPIPSQARDLNPNLTQNSGY